MGESSDRSVHEVELAAVYQLPASVAITDACLGISAPVSIAGLNGEARLPSVKCTADGASAYLIAPALDGLPPLAGRRLFERGERGHEPWFWGIVSSWNAQTSEVLQAQVRALLLRFSGVSAADLTYSDYLHGRGNPIGRPVDQLFGEIDSWFENLRTWLRAFTDQDVDSNVEAGRATVAAEGLEVLTVDGETVSLPRFPDSISVEVEQLQALDERHWRHALDLASRGAVVPVEYSLLGTARVQLRLRQYRRAVIDAASAVELALTDLLHTHQASLPHWMQTQLSQDKQTLGWLVKNVAADSALPNPVAQVYAQFPRDIAQNFVDIRNDVVHRNQTPTFAQAARVLDIALGIVGLVRPLPPAPIP